MSLEELNQRLERVEQDTMWIQNRRATDRADLDVAAAKLGERLGRVEQELRAAAPNLATPQPQAARELAQYRAKELELALAESRSQHNAAEVRLTMVTSQLESAKDKVFRAEQNLKNSEHLSQLRSDELRKLGEELDKLKADLAESRREWRMPKVGQRVREDETGWEGKVIAIHTPTPVITVQFERNGPAVSLRKCGQMAKFHPAP